MLTQQSEAELAIAAAAERAGDDRAAWMAKFARLRSYMGRGGELVETTLPDGGVVYTTRTRRGMSFTPAERDEYMIWAAAKEAKATLSKSRSVVRR